MWGDELNCTLWRTMCFLLLVIFLSACFHDANYPPTANAGPDVIASISQTITLDGTQSSDVDGDSLRFQWSITSQPESSLATLSDAGISKPELYLDVAGQFVLQLVVSDGTHISKPDFVTITTINEKPVAVISEVSVRNGSHYVVGDVISIDARLSTDPENQTLSYTWAIAAKPENSQATLSGSNSISSTFTVDVVGHYIVHLIVSDGVRLSEPKVMLFEIENPSRKSDTRPIAEAGPDQALYTANTIIQLDGSQSYDVENDVLTYQWEIIYKPSDSLAKLSSSTNVAPKFTADILGNYVIKLVVSDVNGESHVDTVIVTPHDNYGLACGDCHNKPAAHLITNDDCAQCHTTNQWNLVTGSFHAHGHMAKPAQCDICHSGSLGKGKAPNHVVTDKDCNHCHLKSDQSWKPALAIPVDPVFLHDGIFSGCINCHDNQIQQGKPAGHMPVSDRCFSCHTREDWSSGLHLEHTVLFAVCTDCHDGVKAKGKSINHIVTNENCSVCHQKTFWSSPKLPSEKFDHTGITQPCINCHNNAKHKARWRPALHINATNDCSGCHSTKTFLPVVKVNHEAVIGECVECHDGLIAMGKGSNHFSTTDRCQSCHATYGYGFYRGYFHHEDSLMRCVDCHNGKFMSGKHSRHILTSDECAACHSTEMWHNIITIDHYETTDDCVICHNGIIAKGQGSFHIATTRDCKYCHSILQLVPSYEINHNALLEPCATCHLVSSGLPSDTIKPSAHPVSSNTCDEAGCHSRTQWKILKPFHHSLQTENCISCHSNTNGTAIGKPLYHVETTDSCEACHFNSVWQPVGAMDHNDVIGTCVSCHDGIIAKGQGRSHILTGGECDFCHSTLQFVPAVKVSHTTPMESCIFCHNSFNVSGKPPSHLKTTDLCNACHSSSFFIPLIGIDHSQILGDCLFCHNGTETTGKVINHVTSSDQCQTCHVTTALNWKLLHSEVHFYLNLPCTNCHVAPAQHLSAGVSGQCESCHIVASWANPARNLSP